jgi:hypothetical protein
MKTRIIHYRHAGRPIRPYRAALSGDRLFILPREFELLPDHSQVYGMLYHTACDQQAGWGIQPFKWWWVQLRFASALSTRQRRKVFDWVEANSGERPEANWYGTDSRGIYIQEWNNDYPPAIRIEEIAYDLRDCGLAQVRAAPHGVHIFDARYCARREAIRQAKLAALRRHGIRAPAPAAQELMSQPGWDDASRSKVARDPSRLLNGNDTKGGLQGDEAFRHETISIAPWFTLDYAAILAGNRGTLEGFPKPQIDTTEG